MLAAADEYERALDALVAGNASGAAKALTRALESNPRDIDSLLLYADLGCDDQSEMLRALQLIEAVARTELGENAFMEDRGHFWGLIETRPYMSTKARIVELLRQRGEADAAIEHCEEMLSLNPNDNQGMREPLLGLYLTKGYLDRANALIAEYDGSSAVFEWGKVLSRILDDTAGDPEEALAQAREANVFVAPLLLGAFEMPDVLPDVFTPGGPNEAVFAGYYLGEGWMQNDAAPLEWLAQRVVL